MLMNFWRISPYLIQVKGLILSPSFNWISLYRTFYCYIVTDSLLPYKLRFLIFIISLLFCKSSIWQRRNRLWSIPGYHLKAIALESNMYETAWDNVFLPLVIDESFLLKILSLLLTSCQIPSKFGLFDH